jgi:hypothetical protein
MNPEQRDAHAERMLAHLGQQAAALDGSEALPESVRTRIERMLPTAHLLTQAEPREYVTLLCVAAYSEGALSMAEQVNGAIAP